MTTNTQNTTRKALNVQEFFANLKNHHFQKVQAEHQNALESLEKALNEAKVTPYQAQKLKNHYETLKEQRQAEVISAIGKLAATVKQKADTKIVERLKSAKAEFFNTTERAEALESLHKIAPALTQEHIEGFAGLVEQLEVSAVERYKKELQKEQTLSEEQQKAKSKLNVLSEKTKNSDLKTQHVFSKKEISKMNSEEFRHNEKEIMKQMRAGLIK